MCPHVIVELRQGRIYFGITPRISTKERSNRGIKIIGSFGIVPMNPNLPKMEFKEFGRMRLFLNFFPPRA